MQTLFVSFEDFDIVVCERLAKLYIDLCAKYIDRLSKFEVLVKRKIKVGQVNDLLNTASSSRLSEEDAATFMNSFDTAFLDLYPSFVTEFNALLREDGQIVPPHKGRLTTELRICHMNLSLARRKPRYCLCKQTVFSKIIDIQRES
jgi:hypothetical protein